MGWWGDKSRSVATAVAPPERDLLETLHEELVMTKNRLDELGRELSHFKREHAIVEFGHSHSIRGCRASSGWDRPSIDRAWNELWQRITRAATNFHSAQSLWADEKLKREKTNAKRSA
jgi:hypothetical protein